MKPKLVFRSRDKLGLKGLVAVERVHSLSLCELEACLNILADNYEMASKRLSNLNRAYP